MLVTKKLFETIFCLTFYLCFFSLSLIKIVGININIIVAIIALIYIIFLELFSGKNNIVAFALNSIYTKCFFALLMYSLCLSLMTMNLPELGDVFTFYILPIIYFIVAFYFISSLGLKRFYICNVVGILPSLIFAVGQFFQIDFFWEIKLGLDLLYAKEFAFLNENMLAPSGLSLFSIQLSYDLLYLICLTALLSYSESRVLKNKHIFGYLLLGLVTMSRSMILAIASLVYLLNKKTIMIIIIFIAFIVLILIQENLDISALSNTSSKARPYLFKTGILVFAEYPWGLTIDYFDAVEQIKHKLIPPNGVPSSWNLIYSPHNAFLNIIIKYGIFGGTITIIFIFYNYLRALNSKNTRIFFICFVPFCIHAFFHNSGILYSDYVFSLLYAVFFYSLRPQTSKMNGNAM